MTLTTENIEPFSRKFEEVVSASILPEFLIPELEVDAVARFSELDFSTQRIIAQMEPFGPENAKPVFISRQVSDTGFSRILKEKHLRLQLRQDDVLFSGIAFNMADKMPVVKSGKPFDIAFTLDLNEWNGEKSLQLKICDFKAAE